MKTKAILWTVFVLFAAACFYSCTDSVRPVDKNSTYTAYGAFVWDDSDSSSVVYLDLTKNNEIYDIAEITFDTFDLAYDTLDNDYFVYLPDSVDLPIGEYTVTIVDSNAFSYIFIDTVPSAPLIASMEVPEETKINPGGNTVAIGWNPALNTDGYILASVKKDSTFTGIGYSKFVEQGFNQATLPPEAFRLFNTETDLVAQDTGWYYIYVYSYTGDPVTGNNLPVPVPEGLTNNIDADRIIGSFGTLIISRPDSIHVVFEI